MNRPTQVVIQADVLHSSCVVERVQCEEHSEHAEEERKQIASLVDVFHDHFGRAEVGREDGVREHIGEHERQSRSISEHLATGFTNRTPREGTTAFDRQRFR